MSDLISRKALKQSINEEIFMGESTKAALRSIVHRQPTIEPYGTWIPVSSGKLPKEHLESVIGWDEYRNRSVFVRYDGREWILGDYESVKIIAWMPKPEPYRKGDEL